MICCLLAMFGIKDLSILNSVSISILRALLASLRCDFVWVEGMFWFEDWIWLPCCSLSFRLTGVPRCWPEDDSLSQVIFLLLQFPFNFLSYKCWGVLSSLSSQTDWLWGNFFCHSDSSWWCSSKTCGFENCVGKMAAAACVLRRLRLPVCTAMHTISNSVKNSV